MAIRGKRLNASQPVVLVGMPGSGKTTVGKALSSLRSAQFYDSDTLVEQMAGMSVATLFATSGEAAFRQLERQVIHRWLEAHRDTCHVLACGGGVMPADVLPERGAFASIFLDAPVHELVRRLWPERSQRPLLAGCQTPQQLADTLFALWFVRYPHYLQADVLVLSGQTSPERVAQTIITLLRYLPTMRFASLRSIRADAPYL